MRRLKDLNLWNVFDVRRVSSALLSTTQPNLLKQKSNFENPFNYKNFAVISSIALTCVGITSVLVGWGLNPRSWTYKIPALTYWATHHYFVWKARHDLATTWSQTKHSTNWTISLLNVSSDVSCNFLMYLCFAMFYETSCTTSESRTRTNLSVQKILSLSCLPIPSWWQ